MQAFMTIGATLAVASGVVASSMPLQSVEPPRTATRLSTPVTLVRVKNLHSGQVFEHAGGASPASGPRGAGVVLDTMSNDGSAAGLNVAYVDPDSYTGESSSTTAFAIGLAERLAYRAPMDAAAGFPLPTDILWNDYACDPARWPGGAAGPEQPIGSFEFVPYFQNTEMPQSARIHTLRVVFFSEDRARQLGGFEAEFRVNPGQTGYPSRNDSARCLRPADRGFSRRDRHG